ncbi:Thioredoxin reductase 2 [Hibiscus syriacus]|uniref:Thioredoxin reductase 2 n=1 Tax=Hibiscus syriacus TaxID=106335 RepID=A0A6A2YZY3_HIBSY|nr:Thioredoxin reductase 2 [Hibiscus syriacus]
MEESTFLTKYSSKVYIIHRRDSFRASKIMQSRVISNPKIEVIRNSVVVEAYGDRVLGGLKVKNVLTGELQLDSDGYVLTQPGTTKTSGPDIFAAGDVQDKKYMQTVTAAGTGCMAALEVEHYLQEIGSSN